MLPDAVAAQYARQLDSDMAAARQVLEGLRGRRLNREQSDLASRIRMFLQQAERIRQRDLAAAAELGRRARAAGPGARAHAPLSYFRGCAVRNFQTVVERYSLPGSSTVEGNAG